MSHATSSKNQVKDVKSEAPQTGQPSWTSTFSNINPWANSRGQAPLAPGQPAENADEKGTGTKETSINQDHLSMPIYGKSFRNYPSDCPPLRVRWFHAVDAPKWTPHSEISGGRNEKKSKANTAKPKPKKFSALSKDDSKRVEKKYQQLLEAVEDQRSPDSRESRKHGEDSKMARVPVNEDFLFEVNIEKRELAPVYWAGPIYESETSISRYEDALADRKKARRGIWFFQEGSKLRPCDENLATQVEEGYLKARPWRQTRTGDNGNEETDNAASMAPQEKISDTVSQASIEPSPLSVGKDVKAEETSKKLPPPSQRLFGAYMNSFITYEDASTAWLTSDSMLSWVTTSVYERFGGGGYMSGVKLIRGYSEQKKTKAKEPSTAVEESDRKAREELTENARLDQSQENSDTENEQKPPQLRLERRLSSFIANESRSEQRLEEDVQKFNEEEIRHDYLTADGESQTREIKHLILVTHGIGQRLSLRMESVNFIHDVNVMRKTLKAVYANSNQLRSVNAESQDGPGNCQVQVLPVCWRNMVDFPKRRNRPHESDLTDAGHEDDEYPSLEDITVEGVSFARSLMSDLALDVLLYQSSYRAEIAKIVIKESNRIVKLFRERNPGFQGQIHVMGHSLGSAILFDILCQQQRRQLSNIQNPLRFLPSRDNESYDIDNGSSFRFDVEDFYCIGSPVGLFQMLNGRTIAGRESLHLNQENPVKSSMPGGYHENGEKADLGSLLDSVSSPEVSQLFNIFHPSDPISYRLEPLIVPQMAELKPKPLPYTKKGIFGSVPGTQGLTDISARVGQSVSGLWSSLSMGITANLLPASMRATPGDTLEQVTEELQSVGGASAAGLSSQTELDNDLESLYSVFQKREDKTAGASTNEADPDAVKWRRGRERLLALNRSGRVDFNIQESALDFNPINTIASHIGYWADEDVSHFILSQLLSRRAKKAGKVDSKNKQS